MKKSKTTLVILLALSGLAGCVHAPPTMYQWGSYESQVYAMYTDPGKEPVENQLQNLENEFQATKKSNGAIPPGFLAHLGYLYYQNGKADQALQSFSDEKSLYPESAVFMDRLIAQLKLKR